MIHIRQKKYHNILLNVISVVIKLEHTIHYLQFETKFGQQNTSYLIYIKYLKNHKLEKFA